MNYRKVKPVIRLFCEEFTLFEIKPIKSSSVKVQAGLILANACLMKISALIESS